MEAVSAAVVDFVGNNSTPLEKASMITHYHPWSVMQYYPDEELQMDYIKHK